MSEENFKQLGLWWSRKMKRVSEKLATACSDLATCGLDPGALREEWALQVQDMAKKAPSEPRTHTSIKAPLG
jgi:hypothetical protein